MGMDGSALPTTLQIVCKEMADPKLSPANAVTQRLVLLGATGAHLRFLTTLAFLPLPDTEVTLVAPQSHTLPGPLLPLFISGHTLLNEYTVALQPLVDRSGVRWLQLGIARVDASGQTVQLSDGSSIPYDWLSIASGPTCNRQQVELALPGARENALFVHPVEHFAALWPRVAALGDQRPLRLAITGCDPQAIEIAFAVRDRLPHAAVTLLCGVDQAMAEFPPPVRQQLLAAIRYRGVTVLQDQALAIHADSLELGCGAKLACDVVMLADRSSVPDWLSASGLALGADSHLSVDAHLRSTSHAQVFVLQSKHEVSQATANLLVRNVRAALLGKPLRRLSPWSAPLQLISCGNRAAIATWGNFCWEGRGVGWLNHWALRRRMAAYTASAKF